MTVQFHQRNQRRVSQAERGLRGMTLMEVLLALAIVSTMMLLAWSTIQATAQVKVSVEDFQSRNHEIRVAMARMNKDLSSAYISANENPNLTERRTLFKGKSSGTVDDLRFSSLAHRPLWANANESEQTLIVYSAERDPDDPSVTNLLRRESRRLSNQPWKSEPADVDILLSDVEQVSFEYWDWKDKSWKKRWDTTGADGQKNRLPSRVKITVEIENDNGKTRKYVSQARIMMSEQLKFVL